MPNKHSMVDIAFGAMSKRKKPMTFAKLWEEVIKELGFNESMAEKKISKFYTDLMLDSRFVSLEDNKWDLKVRHKYEEVHKAISEVEAVDFDDDELEEEITFTDDTETEKTRKVL
jgi:DNA-directed RNA polymerase subunit delta